MATALPSLARGALSGIWYKPGLGPINRLDRSIPHRQHCLPVVAHPGPAAAFCSGQGERPQGALPLHQAQVPGPRGPQGAGQGPHKGGTERTTPRASWGAGSAPSSCAFAVWGWVEGCWTPHTALPLAIALPHKLGMAGPQLS